MNMTSKEKVLHALHHKSGPVPIDFASNPVTSMHASTLGLLREHYGIDRPVKIICELQMIALFEEEDRVALGIDTDGVFGRTSLFGNDYGNGWKEWEAPWGQKVLVTPTFTAKKADDGTTYIYPQGNTTVEPSGIIPSGGYFTTPIVHQEPIIEEELNPDDNLEEFPILSEDDLEYICSAKGMEAEGLKRDFGDAITFWGGGVDTQHTLPFGTPAEVREEVLKRCEVLSANGGMVFNAVHNIQANTPVENVVAMFNAVHEFNGVKHE
jgi:hypothetical protein